MIKYQGIIVSLILFFIAFLLASHKSIELPIKYTAYYEEFTGPSIYTLALGIFFLGLMIFMSTLKIVGDKGAAFLLLTSVIIIIASFALAA